MLFDVHRDDPAFGCWFLVDEARHAGELKADRTGWRICSAMGLWSACGKNGKKPGPPVHDDLVGRDFTAQAPNQLWLADITEHRTNEGASSTCARSRISNRIVGHSGTPTSPIAAIAERLKPRRRTRSQPRAGSPRWPFLVEPGLSPE